MRATTNVFQICFGYFHEHNSTSNCKKRFSLSAWQLLIVLWSCECEDLPTDRTIFETNSCGWKGVTESHFGVKGKEIASHAAFSSQESSFVHGERGSFEVWRHGSLWGCQAFAESAGYYTLRLSHDCTQTTAWAIALCCSQDLNASCLSMPVLEKELPVKNSPEHVKVCQLQEHCSTDP